ncbi:MAG: pyrroline-5-carboxylate reductase [bacterium]|nr:pyrroline-5-carboxylate reductase [bacterium]
MNFKNTISFIGGGNMAEALAGGIVRAGIVPAGSIMISDPLVPRCEYLKNTYGFEVTSGNRQAAVAGGTIFLAVKPQVMQGILDEISGTLREGALVISIAAGITISFLEGNLPRARVIRSMPNTPALVGAGATVISPGSHVHADMTRWAVELFHAVGSCHVLPEELMDAVTGLSGSGPAYIFRMAEALTEAGVAAGIPVQQSGELVRQTILGAARMMVETGQTPTRLREMVTSPGGTTEAGLAELGKAGFVEAVVEAVLAAAKRAGELGQG